MRRHERDVRRLLAAIADESGGKLVKVDFTGRAHLRATFVRGRVTAIMTFGSTPSDWRTFRNIAADTRRALRRIEQITGER
jgi:hypothetical protein